MRHEKDFATFMQRLDADPTGEFTPLFAGEDDLGADFTDRVMAAAGMPTVAGPSQLGASGRGTTPLPDRFPTLLFRWVAIGAVAATVALLVAAWWPEGTVSLDAFAGIDELSLADAPSLDEF